MAEKDEKKLEAYKKIGRIWPPIAPPSLETDLEFYFVLKSAKLDSFISSKTGVGILRPSGPNVARVWLERSISILLIKIVLFDLLTTTI